MKNYRLIQIEKTLVLLDLKAEINLGDWMAVYSTGINGIGEGYSISQFNDTPVSKLNKICEGTYKIIASSDFDCLPLIYDSIEDIKEMIRDNDIEDLSIRTFPPYGRTISENDYSGLARGGFKKGYKSNKALYTREQMLEAIKLAKTYRRDNNANYTEQQILESLEPKIDCFVEVEEKWTTKLRNSDYPVPEGVFGCNSDVDHIKEYSITKIL